jgi:hypothetical protein
MEHIMQLNNVMWLVALISWLLAKSCLLGFRFDLFLEEIEEIWYHGGKKQWKQPLMGGH